MFRIATAAGLFVGSALTSGAMAGTALSEGWAEMPLSQDGCINRAKAIISVAGFPRNETVAHAIYGYSGDYTAAVRCAAGKKMVIFIVAGPNAAVAAEAAKKLRAAFFQ